MKNRERSEPTQSASPGAIDLSQCPAATPEYWGLNEEQTPPYWTRDHAVVVAAPGSGKTRLMVAKIARLAIEVGPEQVVGVTFTRASAEEMRERLVRAIGDLGKKIVVDTFHRACYVQLKRAGVRVDLIKDSRHTIIRIKNRIAPELDDDTVINGIAKLKSMIDPPEPRGGERSTNRRIYSVYLQYEDYLRRGKTMDMQDLILDCVRSYRQNGPVRPMNIKHLLVDEFQDVDRAQYAWVVEHARAGAIITAVGDDDQSIYGFRSSMGHVALNGLSKHINARKFFLSTNYRSDYRIVAAADRLMSLSEARIHKTIQPHSKAPGEVMISMYDSQESEAAAAVDHFLSLRKKAGTKPLHMAILARTNMQLRRPEVYASSRQIHVERVGFENIMDRKHVMQAIAAVTFGVDPESMASLRTAMSASAMSAEAINTIDRLINNHNLQAEPLLDRLYMKQVTEDISKGDATIFRQFREALAQWRECVEQHGGAATQEDNAALAQGLDTLRHLVRPDASTGSKTDFDTKAEDVFIIINILANRMTGPIKSRLFRLCTPPDRAERTDHHRLTLITLHSAKGLEYDAVWVLTCNDGVLPHKNADIEDELRLMYVGMTRAKHDLALSFLDYGHRKPSPFLGAIDTTFATPDKPRR